MKVRRIRIGERIAVFDGQGREITGIVRSIEARGVKCDILKVETHLPPVTKISLALGILRPGAMAFACEKAAEAGVWEIVPLLTDHSTRRPPPSEVNRLNRVTLAGTKQSGGFFWPKVHLPVKLPDLLKGMRAYSGILYADPGGEPILSLPHLRGDTLVIVGSEGGFSAGEMEVLKAGGNIAVSLGERRLRSETAAIIALGCLALKVE